MGWVKCSSSLPDYGVRVLGVTVRPTPFPSDALIRAFEETGLNSDQAKSMAAIFGATGRELPNNVLAKLSDWGHRARSTRSAVVEMWRVDPEKRDRLQAVGENGWTCDAFPLVKEYDLLPTHWCLYSEVEDPDVLLG